MEYEELVSDFASRTKANLQLIESHAAGRLPGDGYEVTQLVNSMLGLLVFPREKWLHRIPPTPTAQLVAAGWPAITVSGALPEDNLRGLTRYLRNGIAHFNVDFISEGGQITGMRIWNTRPDDQRDWVAEMSVRDLRFIAIRFVEMLSSGGL